MTVAEQALSIYAVDKGYMDDVAVNKIGSFETALHAHFTNTLGELMNSIAASGDWNDGIEDSFKKGIEDFKATGSW